jgi:hypothetical protein
MEYDTGLLREGGRLDRESAEAARSTERTLRSISISASAFGDFAAAARFAGHAALIQGALVGGAAGAAAHRDDQGARADSAAAQGDDLTSGTTAIARSEP